MEKTTKYFIKFLYEEFKFKLLTHHKPSKYLNYLRDNSYLPFIPELNALIGVPQDPAWHPEGDVWNHTLMVVDEAAKLKDNLQTLHEKEAFMLGSLCHDFAKPFTTIYIDGRWRSPKHESILFPVRNFLLRMYYNKPVSDETIVYVKEHLQPIHLYKNKNNVSDKAIMKLADRISIEKLLLLGQADHFGRLAQDAVRREYPAGKWLYKRYTTLAGRDKKNMSKPFLSGKILLEMNLKPGRKMGELIRLSYQMQIDGKINSVEEAVDWAKTQL